MKLDPRVDRLLKVSIHNNLYEVCTVQTLVTEATDEGAATVTCTLPQEVVGIRWKIETASLFPFLKEKLAADGAVILQLPDGTYEAHIMECKLTVNQDSWARAKRQMRWTLIRLRALAGVLGIQFKRVVCYTAYRFERWETGLVKIPIGAPKPVNDEQAETIDLLQQQGDWLAAEIELRDFDPLFLHRKVVLNSEDGMGQVALT